MEVQQNMRFLKPTRATLILTAILFFAMPAMALACNWGAQVEGDCQKLTLTVGIARGDQEAAGSWKLYWSQDGNAKDGKVIAEGQIPELKKGENHQVVYELKNNPNGPEGNYIFYLKEPRGSIWSNQVEVKGCEKKEEPKPVSVLFTGQGGDCSVIWAELKNGENSAEIGGGKYEVWYSASGEAKDGKVVASGDVQALKPGETAKLTFDLNQNGQAAGNYAFKFIHDKGEAWSGSVTVDKSCQPAQGEQPGGQEPEQPTTGQQPAPHHHGGTMPKTATQHPAGMMAGLLLVSAGAAMVLVRRRSA
jgi:LPXTG-motif cell wall-anchored protein